MNKLLYVFVGALVLSACAPQAQPTAVVQTVIVVATPTPAPAAPPPTVSTAAPVTPPTAAAPAPTSVVVPANPCPTKDFLDVSGYKPKAGWPTPRLKVTCEATTFLVETNGIPNFDVIIKPTTEVSYKLSFPLNPQKAAQPTDAILGYVAVAVNGVPIWAPSESPQDGQADPVLEKLMEVCNGHAVPFHFHARPDCLFKTTINQTNLVVAYALDGFPIMAPYICEDSACTKIKKVKSSWEVANANVRNVWQRYKYVEGSGDLDKCNGRTGVDGKYRYYATDNFPYTLPCFTGTTIMNPREIDRMANAGAAAGGPQQGGQQPPQGGQGQPPQGGQPPSGGTPPPPRP